MVPDVVPLCECLLFAVSISVISVCSLLTFEEISMGELLGSYLLFLLQIPFLYYSPLRSIK